MHWKDGRYTDVFKGRGMIGNQNVVLWQWLAILLVYTQINPQRPHKRSTPGLEQGEIKTIKQRLRQPGQQVQEQRE